jgi:hypothetical protein
MSSMLSKRHFAAAFASTIGAAVASTGPAIAQSGVQPATLTCDAASSIGFI